MKGAKYKDLEDMVNRLELPYEETVEIFDVKYNSGSTKGYTLQPGIYQITDNILILKSLLPKEIKVNNPIDLHKLRSNLTTIKTIMYTKKSSSYKFSGFTQSYLGSLGDIEGFIQHVKGTCRSEKLNNIIGIDKIRSKCDCSNRSIFNGIRETILYSFVFTSPAGPKFYKKLRIEHFKR